MGLAEGLPAWREARPAIEDRLSQMLGRRVELTLAGPPDPDEASNPFWRNVRSDGRVLAGARIEEVTGAA